MHRSRPLVLATLLALAALPAFAGSAEVKLKLPQRAKLDLQGRKTVAVVPFLVVSQEGAEKIKGRNIDVQKEFDRYLVKVLRRETELKVIEPGPIQYPTYALDQLASQTDFWHDLGERTGADLVLAGGLDFDIQDRSGYRTEEYTSPYNGRTYLRQVLVEQTGFQYDILMQVYDGKTGALLYQDNFKDFQSFEGENTDPLAPPIDSVAPETPRRVCVVGVKNTGARGIRSVQWEYVLRDFGTGRELERHRFVSRKRIGAGAYSEMRGTAIRVEPSPRGTRIDAGRRVGQADTTSVRIIAITYTDGSSWHIH